MKKLFFCLLLTCFFANNTSLAHTFNVDAAVPTRYTVHDVNIGLTDKEAFQLGIYKPLSSRIKFAVWSSFILDREFDNLDEVDVMFIWSKSFFDDSRLKIVPNCYIDYWFYHGIKVDVDIGGNNIDEMTFQGNKFNMAFHMSTKIAKNGRSISPFVHYQWTWEAVLIKKTNFGSDLALAKASAVKGA